MNRPRQLGRSRMGPGGRPRRDPEEWVLGRPIEEQLFVEEYN